MGRMIVKAFFLTALCAAVILVGVTVVRVNTPSYHGASSLFDQCGITARQQIADAHTPVTEACNLPNNKADAAFNKCEANCRSGCGGWCEGAAAYSGCVVGCAVMRDYAKGTASYQ